MFCPLFINVSVEKVETSSGSFNVASKRHHTQEYTQKGGKHIAIEPNKMSPQWQVTGQVILLIHFDQARIGTLPFGQTLFILVDFPSLHPIQYFHR